LKLGKKIVIAIGLVWVLFFLVIYIGSNILLTQGFIRLENNRANEDLYRAKEAFFQLQTTLYNFVNDWGHWDELYDYIGQKNPDFIK
jgi:sensor domain CHASE-containing protein